MQTVLLFIYLFYLQEFVGNTDENSIVKISLRPSKARFVRFYPLLHYFSPCLSVEIFVLK